MLNMNLTEGVSDYQTEGLTQWDADQVLQISGVTYETTPAVHFANKKSDKALVVTPTVSSGVLTVDIPNSLLRQPYPIVAYIYSYDNDSGSTNLGITIPVTPRVEPDDYIFQGDTGFITLASINSKVDTLISESTNKINNLITTKTKELDTLKSDKEKALDSLIETKTKELDNLKSTKSDELDALKTSKTQELDNLIKIKGNALDDLATAKKKDLEDLYTAKKSDLEALYTAKETALNDLYTAKEKELDNLITAKSAELTQLGDTLTQRVNDAIASMNNTGGDTP